MKLSKLIPETYIPIIKNGTLIRTAEQLGDGTWVVVVYKGDVSIAGNYDNKAFQKIKKKYFNQQNDSNKYIRQSW